MQRRSINSKKRLSRRTLRTVRNAFQNYPEQSVRERVCWNCLQEGHLRFQCPNPKRIFCSYCRTPNVRSCECNCQSNEIEPAVIDPPIQEFENIQVEVLYIQEDDDKDILEIFAEDEPLE